VLWNLRLLIIVFINILAILTCIRLVVFVLFICLLINATNCLLNLLDALIWVIVFLTKVMFTIIHALIDFVYLVMLFSLKINIFFPLMLHPFLRYLFLHTLMTCLLLLNDSSLDLCMNDNAQLYLFLIPTRHLSLFRRCLSWLSRILTLFLTILLESLVLVIGMYFLLHHFMLLCHLFQFLDVIPRQLNMNVSGRPW